MSKCKWCGAEIAAGRKAQYCDLQCYQSARSAALAAGTAEKLDERTCRYCGKVFTPTRRTNVYCCIECRTAAADERAATVRIEVKETKPKPNLDRTLKELDAYNKAHNTDISYGKWMAGMRERTQEEGLQS